MMIFFFLQYKKVTITTTSECIIVYRPMVPEMKLFYSTVAKILLPVICAQACMHLERRGSVVVSTSAWHAAGRRFDSRTRHVSLLGVKSWLSTGIVYL